jgi:hypothetical protein
VPWGLQPFRANLNIGMSQRAEKPPMSPQREASPQRATAAARRRVRWPGLPRPGHRFDAAAFATGGIACSPSILGIGAVSGHHEHRSPSTNVATDARGWRSTLRRSIAWLVPQPGQNTSSHGVPAISAARIVGDHSMSRLAASCSFQRSMTAFASARAASSVGSGFRCAQSGPPDSFDPLNPRCRHKMVSWSKPSNMSRASCQSRSCRRTSARYSRGGTPKRARNARLN